MSDNARILERLADIADAASVRPGDEILIDRIGVHLVAAVDEDTIGMTGTPCVIISYFSYEQTGFENRARDRSGPSNRRLLCEKTLRPFLLDEKVLVIRGSAGAAETTRARMEREQLERWWSQQERAARAQARREDAERDDA